MVHIYSGFGYGSADSPKVDGLIFDGCCASRELSSNIGTDRNDIRTLETTAVEPVLEGAEREQA